MSSGFLATWGEHGIEVLGDLDLANGSKEIISPAYDGPSVLFTDSAQVFKAQWSDDGKYLAYVTATSFNLINTHDFSLVRSISPILHRDSKDRLYPIESFVMDPLGNFVVLFTRFYQPLQNESTISNAILYSIATEKELLKFTIARPEDYNKLQFTSNGRYFVTLSADGGIRVHDLSKDEMTITMPISQPNAKFFSLSPLHSTDKYSIAIGVPSSSDQIATAATFDLLSGKQLSTKMAMSVDSFDFTWSSDASFCSVLLTCLISRDHESYMADNRHAILPGINPGAAFEAPLIGKNSYQIQKCSFSKRSRKTLLGLIYGSMPARTSLFDHELNRIYDFKDGYRNDFHVSPGGRFLALGGRGSIPGKYQVYDIKKGVLVSKYLRAKGAHIFEWTNSGKTFLMSVVSPQLKVDNAVHFFRADGHNYYNREYKYLSGTAMSPILSWPEERALPAWMVSEAVETAQKSSGRWIPPSLRDKVASEPTEIVGNDISKVTPPASIIPRRR